MNNFTKRRVNWFAVLLGILLLCFQLPILPATVDFVKTSKVVPGEVVRLNAGRHPQVEFITLDGQRVSTPASSWFDDVDVGDKVEMRYDPKAPGIAKINTLFGVWGVHLFFVAPAIGLILGGLLGFPSKKGWGWESEGNNDS